MRWLFMKIGQKMKHDVKPLKAGIHTRRNKGKGFINNAGYTLLEMIVVCAMLAVGITIVSMSINTIFSLEMKQCTKNIGSELGKEKVAAMTRAGEVYMRLYKNSDGIFIDKYENDVLVESRIKVGTAKITVKYYSESNPDGTPIDNSGIIIAFNKSNGSFKTIKEAWMLFDSSHNAPDENYSKLVVSSSTSRTISLWPDTGKFSISG